MQNEIFDSWVTVKNEIFNSKMKFLIRGVLFPGDGIGKKLEKENTKKVRPSYCTKKLSIRALFLCNM